DRTAPLLYEAWLGAVGTRLARTRTGGAADFVLPIPTLVRVITAPDGAFGRDPEAARDSLVLAALDDALAEISTQLGADRSRWSWGALHRAVFRHPVAAAFDLPGVPRGGDGNTVNATGSGGDYEQRYGASYREILDCADWDRSVATSVPGQSGQPGSPHYGDLLAGWAEGRYFPLVFSRARGAGDGARAHADTARVTKLLDTMRQRSSAPQDRLPPGQVLTTKWPVLHYGNVPKVDTATSWTFDVTGVVERPFTLTYAQLL